MLQVLLLLLRLLRLLRLFVHCEFLISRDVC